MIDKTSHRRRLSQPQHGPVRLSVLLLAAAVGAVAVVATAASGAVLELQLVAVQVGSLCGGLDLVVDGGASFGEVAIPAPAPPFAVGVRSVLSPPAVLWAAWDNATGPDVLQLRFEDADTLADDLLGVGNVSFAALVAGDVDVSVVGDTDCESAVSNFTLRGRPVPQGTTGNPPPPPSPPSPPPPPPPPPVSGSTTIRPATTGPGGSPPSVSDDGDGSGEEGAGALTTAIIILIGVAAGLGFIPLCVLYCASEDEDDGGGEPVGAVMSFVWGFLALPMFVAALASLALILLILFLASCGGGGGGDGGNCGNCDPFSGREVNWQFFGAGFGCGLVPWTIAIIVILVMFA